MANSVGLFTSAGQFDEYGLSRIVIGLEFCGQAWQVLDPLIQLVHVVILRSASS